MITLSKTLLKDLLFFDLLGESTKFQRLFEEIQRNSLFQLCREREHFWEKSAHLWESSKFCREKPFCASENEEDKTDYLKVSRERRRRTRSKTATRGLLNGCAIPLTDTVKASALQHDVHATCGKTGNEKGESDSFKGQFFFSEGKNKKQKLIRENCRIVFISYG